MNRLLSITTICICIVISSLFSIDAINRFQITNQLDSIKDYSNNYISKIGKIDEEITLKLRNIYNVKISNQESDKNYYKKGEICFYVLSKEYLSIFENQKNKKVTLKCFVLIS
jgi:hypothetical protein